MWDLLSPQTQRATSFHRGSQCYDPLPMGSTDSGSYVLDALYHPIPTPDMSTAPNSRMNRSANSSST
jgi:hypothetical protein